MNCAKCGVKIYINWGTSDVVLCEKHSNELDGQDSADASTHEKRKMWMYLLLLVIAPLSVAFFPLILGFSLLGLSKIGLYKMSGGEGVLGFAFYYTFPAGLIIFFVGLIISLIAASRS